MTDAPMVTKTEQGDTYTFYCELESTDKQFKTKDVILAWLDESYVEKNPECPISYIKCAFKNRNTLLDIVKKQVRYVQIERNGKIYMVPENATKDEAKKLFRL
jgi:6-phosphogluconolactonase/glucosamine-6-phosphate isomerase/deaminase